ncbi:hypothetical protein LSH36_646g00014 [Paralvinella palmiformis]|uniref:Uncharacterized protein n=1 Tax=Paralvinella palmiformis TaxID=53620 RepID=A0AAD9J4J4_9ANNE|nr:hypothetical protein LSH36_646g00014 [Paralvinella palmiformis]
MPIKAFKFKLLKTDNSKQELWAIQKINYYVSNNDQHNVKTSVDIKASRLNHLALLELLFSLVEHPLWKDVIRVLGPGYYCLIYQALFGPLLDMVYDISDKI